MPRLSQRYTRAELLLDMSPSDIVIATLFYQYSLYVCVRLARRGFTLGELGVVCNAATALFMETVNLTRMKVSPAPESVCSLANTWAMAKSRRSDYSAHHTSRHIASLLHS